VTSPSSTDDRRGQVAFHDRPGYRWWVLGAGLAGVFVAGALITIIGVSLATVAEDLGTSTASLTWVITGPLLAVALTMPLFGKLGDVWGLRRVYLLGLLGFTVGSILTAFAWNGPSLIAFRILGAIPGAAMGPTAMALVMRTFPPADRVKAMGWWSLVGAGAPVIGVIAGGPLVEIFGWRALFVAQAPLSIAAFVLGVVVLREAPRRGRQPIDLAGAATLAVGTTAALLGLTIGGREGWGRPVVPVLGVVAVIGLAAFVRAERRAEHPLLPLAFFRQRDYSASLSAQFASNFAYMGGFIITPLLFQYRFGYSVAATAGASIVRPLTFSLVAAGAGYVAARVGVRRSAITGLAILAGSMIAFTVAALAGNIVLVYVGLFLSGLGMGSASPSLVSSAANAVPHEDQGVANAAQQMAASIGTVAGIQVLSTIQGGGRTAASFGPAYLVGACMAACGVVAASFLAPHVRRRA
jgi:EmrB/QacA subfamily drug resistance transporter